MGHPDFIIIGAQKSGTSWLHMNLRRHPDIWMPEVEMHGWRDKPLQEYLSIYDRSESKTGEKGPEYFHMPRYAVRKLTEDLPATIFIALLRRPYERAWSQARMECSRYNRQEAPGPMRLFVKCMTVRNRQRTRYDRILQNWMACADDRLHVYYYDDLCDRPGWLLSRVCENIGVNPTVPAKKRVWASPERDIPPLVQAELEQLYEPVIRRLSQLGFAPPKGWFENISVAAKSLKLRFIRYATGACTAPYYLYHQIRFLRLTAR